MNINLNSEYSTILSQHNITQTDLVDLSTISFDDVEKVFHYDLEINEERAKHFLDINDLSIEEFNESPERLSPGIP